MKLSPEFVDKFSEIFFYSDEGHHLGEFLKPPLFFLYAGKAGLYVDGV